VLTAIFRPLFFAPKVPIRGSPLDAGFATRPLLPFCILGFVTESTSDQIAHCVACCAPLPGRLHSGHKREEEMSEYQYYEFQAIDRPLTSEEMQELRQYSSRARITPTSFVNDYAWGDFRGDVTAWMHKYFDAHLYMANWGTRVLKLRLPDRLLDPATAASHVGRDSFSFYQHNDMVILQFFCEDEGDGWIDGEGTLASIIPVRAELAWGDLRALYLGWLLAAQNGEFADDEVEPEVPPGLGQLNASLENLADFLGIDNDLLEAASRTSQPLQEPGFNRNEVRAWVSRLPAAEKDEMLTRLIVDSDRVMITELVQRLRKEQSAGAPPSSCPRRTVGELLQAAEELAEERARAQALRQAEEKARREREAALARKKQLERIAGREDDLWVEVDDLVDSKLPKSYDQAVKILVDLRDLFNRSKTGDFRIRLQALRQLHARKPSFLNRLTKAGL
jgi:hypothetical protein